MNSRFSDQAIDLLTLSCALIPKGSYKAFNTDTISILVEKYYPMDFNEQEKITLQFQLQQFLVDTHQSSDLKNLSTIQKLCSCFVATNTNKIYFFGFYCHNWEIFFSNKIIQTKLQNKMKGRFLTDSMSVYIEREITACISSDSIIDDFKSLNTSIIVRYVVYFSNNQISTYYELNFYI